MTRQSRQNRNLAVHDDVVTRNTLRERTNRMRSPLCLGLLLLTALLIVSCSDKGTDPRNDQTEMQLSQLPGCQHGSIGKSAAADSCFSYQFTENLHVNFCLVANCCPDSNRFAFASGVSRDSIVVSVRDTAGQLCRCLCSYTIRCKFAALPLDRYWFVCLYGDSVQYAAEVVRG